MRTRELVHKVSPPILLDAVRGIRAKLTGSRSLLPVWQVVPEGWSRADDDPHVKGWNVAAIRDWHRASFETWSHAFEPPRSLGTSEYAPDQTTQHLHSHNVHVSFAYVVALTARGRKSLSILDWGGGVGQHYLLSRAVLPHASIAYSCRDVPLLCAEGRRLLPDVAFFDDDGCFERSYDLVLASNSLQYSEDWQDVLRKLAAAARHYLYVAQLPTVDTSSSFVAVQRPYSHGYDSEYLGWILNRRAVLEAAESANLSLVREFFFDNEITVQGADEIVVHRGFLFQSGSTLDSSKA